MPCEGFEPLRSGDGAPNVTPLASPPALPLRERAPFHSTLTVLRGGVAMALAIPCEKNGGKARAP